MKSGTVASAVKVVAVGPIISKREKGPNEKPDIHVRGMYGIGDCIFERAVLKTLMQKYDVHVSSYYSDMFHDLVDQGLRVSLVKDGGRIRDSSNRSEPAPRHAVRAIPPRAADLIRLTYGKELIHKHGSILAAMFASANLTMPAQPDFSLPVKAEWRSQARALLKGLNKDGKPLLVYRPIVLNTTWTAPARAPDPTAYAVLYRAIRKKFFVVSVADLKDKGGKTEWIVGPPADVDLKLHQGELDFGSMVGLFAEASMIFANPGFTPVLAQAVGTPVVIVYGGNESFRTTNSVGKHLAPTCAIDADYPCECHNQIHNCNKTISIEPAQRKIMAFTETVLNKPKVLIFGTTYVDTPERAELTRLWVELHSKINPDCDLLLVDSASPLYPKDPAVVGITYSFPDNVGHLSRNGPKGPNSGGRDGWGRAFCKGLEYACQKRETFPESSQRVYDYVVHIEGDSLFKLPVLPIIQQMRDKGRQVLSVPVKGTKQTEQNWVETGLMFFDTEYLVKSGFIEKYDWANRKATPTPERVIFSMLDTMQFELADWKALRGDKNQISVYNVSELDWVTHVKDTEIYRKFAETALFLTRGETLTSGEAVKVVPVDHKVKINLGCGTNRLEGWQNYDKELSITAKLPFKADQADFIFAEHVVEHVSYNQALSFFKECARVLKPGGIIRITVPSLEQIMNEGVPEYFEFVHSKKWAPTKDRRGAMHAILHCHGHQTAWTESLLMSTLFYCGFAKLTKCDVGKSRFKELKGVEGHHRVIGEHFNAIESISVEGTVDK